MKVALMLCPNWDSTYASYPLASLAAALRGEGHEVGIFDVNRVFALLDRCATGGARLPVLGSLTTAWTIPSHVESQLEAHRGYLERLVERILSEGCRVVGFSLYFSNVLMSLELARLFKKRDPAVAVVFGGPECLTFERCLRLMPREGFDAVVCGEADVPFPRFIARFERAGRLEAVPGVLLRADQSTWKPAGQDVADLDALPFADYGAHKLARHQRKVINTSRGCVRRCDFCSEWRQMRFRQMTGERVHRELAHQIGADPDMSHFFFGDSLVNGVMKKLDSFCDAMIERPLDLTWGGFAIVRPEMTRPFLDKLRRSGCRGLFYGVETGSDDVSFAIGKNTPAKLVAAVLKDSTQAGIETTTGWFVGHPTETEEDFQQSLDFVRRNARWISIMSPGMFVATEVHGRQAELGLAPIEHDWFWESRDGVNAFPERVRRLRLLMRAAIESGITVGAGTTLEEADAHCEGMLAQHARWLEDRRVNGR